MKKSVLFLVAVLSILVSCSKESSSVQNDTITPEETTVQEPTEEMCYLTAVFEKEQPSSKANIADDGAFSWSNGDAIAVFNSTDNKYYLFVTDAENGATSAKFSRVAVPGSNWALAYYPASVVMSSEEISAGVSSVRNNSTTVTLPASYSSIAVAERSFAMKATVSGSSLYFQHLGALMRFKFKNVPYQATKMVLEMNSGISGTYTVSSGNPAEITATGTGTTTVIFDKGTASTISVPIPTATYSSFSVTFKDSDDHVLFAKSATDLAFVVSRANIYASSSALNAKGEEFYLLCKWSNDWSFTSHPIRFIKIGANKYRVAQNFNKSDHGYKICPGYYWGTADNWAYTYGSTANDGSYNGSLQVNGNNCGAGWNAYMRIQYFTIDMEKLTYTTTEPNPSTYSDTSASGATEMYFLSDDTTWGVTDDNTMTKTADQNWCLKNVSLTSGGRNFKLFEANPAVSDWAKYWGWNDSGTYGDTENITDGTPYTNLSYTATKDGLNAGYYSLEAGKYNIYFNSYLGDIWFEKQ